MIGLGPTASSNDNMTIMYARETSILSLQTAGKRKTKIVSLVKNINAQLLPFCL
jgi:hypothetical protein